MDITNISKTEIRLTPNGFCWVFHGRKVEGGKNVEVTLYFDFTWAKVLAADLRRMLSARDAETEAARKELPLPLH